MSCGQLEECEQECMTLLRTDPGNDVATGVSQPLVRRHTCTCNILYTKLDVYMYSDNRITL